jgi:small-conductance mechanosensitive channel
LVRCQDDSPPKFIGGIDESDITMVELFNKFFSDPLFKEGVITVVSVVVIFILVQLAQSLASKKIEDKALRYKTRKAFSMAGYVLMLFAVVIIFSDQMTNLTVIIGALSVGIGFALRELIQSLIGWMMISFGGLYKPGERIQVGSIMGDVIDIGLLNTTVMECGSWVKADLYNGRLVRMSNSLVFKDHIINYTSDFFFFGMK